MDRTTLYRTWRTRLAEYIPDECSTRQTNLLWLIVGLYLARSVYASAIVRQWPVVAKVVSLTRRLSRFLDNPAVEVRTWYRATAQQVLGLWAGDKVTLIMDASQVGFGHQLLMVAAAYRRRAIPIAWCWVRGQRGHSSAATQLALWAYVRRLVPTDTQVIVVGDAEFGSISVLEQLARWGWSYVLRQKGSHRVAAHRRRTWHALADLVTHPRQWAWWPQARLTQQWAYHTTVFAYWAKGENEPWLLATNLPDRYAARRAYARRMWIEEMFGDLKDHGFDLEATHLRHFLRLNRLTLAVCLLYVWLLFIGHAVIRAGQRHWVDRRDRRDLSLFRIGADFIERCLILLWPFPKVQLPQVSGG
ncbi:MAG TPA: IS4 family transposase [Anaerolineae bacterium]|nr:IS4 family transposase [Anaerolineae bacterium]